MAGIFGVSRSRDPLVFHGSLSTHKIIANTKEETRDKNDMWPNPTYIDTKNIKRDIYNHGAQESSHTPLSTRLTINETMH